MANKNLKPISTRKSHN